MAAAAEDLVPELGDKVTIVSAVFKRTTGRIVYRDDKLIRIRPDYRATSGIDFPLDPETQLFRESLGVSEVLIHEKRTNPAFAAQLAVFRNDRLLFYSIDGDVLGAPGIVSRVVTSDTEDAVILTDGRVLDFGFVGPADPIAIVLPYQEEENWEGKGTATAAAAAATAFAATAEEGTANADAVNAWEAELDVNRIEAPPTVDDRTYDDTTQREGMFLSLLKALPYNQQKNPKLLARLYREADLLIALKNAVVVRDASQAIVLGKHRSYIARTVKEVAALESVPLSAVIPVAAVKKVLYVDRGEQDERAEVVVRNDTKSLTQALRAKDVYSVEGRNGFAAYIQEIAKCQRVFMPMNADPTYTRYDRDVFRSRAPPQLVEGFPTGLPGGYKLGLFQSRGAPLSLSSNKITTIRTGLSRLLTGTYVEDPHTKIPFLVAEADALDALDHVLLSNEAAQYQQTPRSSVLLWDILSSVKLRARPTPFGAYLDEHWGEQRVLGGEDVALAPLLQQRIAPSLSFVEKDTIQTLDSLGLRNLEMTNELLNALQLEVAQTAWRASDEGRAQRARASRETVSEPVIGSLVGPESALLDRAVLTDPLLRSVVLPNTTPLSALLSLSEASLKTIAPYWIALANKSADSVVDPLRVVAAAETRRLQLAQATRLALNARIVSKPKYNPCEHVVMIERIRNIRNTHKRMDMLESYLQTMGAGQAAHWILCGLCKLPLVCKHEVLLLQEFRHPGRGQVLHKTLLLDYASPHVFEGSYICKLCGQPIQRLEYDTSLEFDDDGTPLSGRTVLVEEPDPDEEGGDDDTNVFALLEDSADSYTGEDKKHYQLARMIVERCGMNGTPELYKRMIAAAKDYLGAWVPTEEYYNQQREKARKAADVAIAAAKAAGKKAPEARIPAEFRKFVANFHVTVMGALAVLELQTSRVTIPFPAPGCPFSTDGFPLDGDNPESDGKGALSYVSCVVAGIYRDDVPWKYTTWSTEMDLPRRRAAVLGAVQSAALRLLGLPNLPPLTTVTERYRAQIREVREARSSATSSVVLPSRGDVLPAAFRPLPFLKPLPGRANAVANEVALTSDMLTRPYAEAAAYLTHRNHALSHTVLSEFTNAASKSVQRHPMRSEGVCCVVKLQEVKERGLGYEGLSIPEATKREIDVLARSGQGLQDPAASAKGTHVFVPWSAPVAAPQLPALQRDEYYKLFLKKCAKGRRTGLTHEFNALPEEDVCRHCGFRLPAELRYLTTSEITTSVVEDVTVKEKKSKKIEDEIAAQEGERKTIALAAFEAQAIPVTDERAFQALEAAVKARGLIAPEPPLSEHSTFTILRSMMDQFDPVLLRDAREQWGVLLTVLDTIQTRGLTGVKRAQEWSKFSSIGEDMLRDLARELASRNASASEYDTPAALDTLVRETREAPLPSHNVDALVRSFVDMTARPVVAAHTLTHFLVTLGQQATSTPYTQRATDARMGHARNLPLSKWFPSINHDHLEILRAVWLRDDSLITPFNLYLKNSVTAVKRIELLALQRMSAWLGPVLSHFIHSFRNSTFVTEEEWGTILQFLIGSAARSLLDTRSPLYADASSPTLLPEVVQFFSIYLQEVLSGAVAQFARYQRTDLEIRRILRIREEIEKSIFIKRFATLDKSLRDIEIIKKTLKLGEWGQGRLENLVNYKSATVGFQLGQIKTMGINVFGDHIGEPAMQQQQQDDAGLTRVPAAREAYTVRSAMDEDV
jgi:hypothetical protein